ncbi:indoleacetamide hydrolase [Paraburkholderia sp. NMBU_R16]|uniref:indoleacetamide hydrolase n=1 Tax=Paraburkholderia sp. NMBU_R16 TaxID=2698676 RepID=UPI0015641E88|nr:indoleacetamide hydrolase [Paraburkholderia sp. NMBU_R16]NRO98155.1 indoleacetamide hydrolase [Paraburkholderia sp. NMBU_R16]
MSSLTDAQPWTSGAHQAVFAIRSGHLKAVDYVTALLARAESYSSLHAFITLETDSALAAASRIDALTDNERARYPLAGLPIAVKANINVAGTRTCAGTPALAGFIASTTAPTVTRLVDAGAIVLGKTNMHELAVGITSTNFSAHAGPVRNPYDRAKIPGGSSGGTAAALAARIVAAGLGTDTGGSTRIPAALTGTAGLRPSVGNGGAERRYRNGQEVLPISHTRDTAGPMARTVADLALLDGIATGDTTLPQIELTRLRIGLPRECWRQLDSALEATAHAARERLEQAGVTFVDVEMAELMSISDRISLPIAFTELRDDVPAWLAANSAPVRTLEAVAARIASPDVRRIYDAALAGAFAEGYPDAMRVLRPELQRRYVSIFEAAGLDALLFPTTPLPAVDIDDTAGSSVVTIGNGAPVDEMAAYLRHTDPASIAGLPGLSLPAGLTPTGLPVGIEIDGPLGSDRHLLAIGIAFESVLGALPPPC